MTKPPSASRPAPHHDFAPPVPEAAFAPLPLRARGVLENVDVAFRLFKQSWKPLLAWAAIINVLMVVASYFSLLIGPPLMIGPACCVLAAAVRGQDVTFSQCWGFSRQRIWGVLAMHVLASLVAFAAIFALALALALAGTALRVHPGVGVSVALSVIGAVLFVLLLSAAMAWQSMVGLVACMEDEFRSSGALRRAWTLLRGRWKAAIAMLTVLNLALLVLLGVMYGFFALIMGADGVVRAVQGGGQGSILLGGLGAVTASTWLLATLFMPINTLAQALFYLDARVRNEALDLEWNAHRTTEAAQAARPAALAPHSQASAPQTFFERIETPGTALSDAPNAPNAAPADPADQDGASSTWSDSPFAPR